MLSTKVKIVSFIVCSFLSLAFVPFRLFADDVIQDFDSEIRVEADSSLLITETIILHMDGSKVRRGLMRPLPSKEQVLGALSQKLEYEVLKANRSTISSGVLSDTRNFPLKAEDKDGQTVLVLGDPAERLAPGDYQFLIQLKIKGLLAYSQKDQREGFAYNALMIYPFPKEKVSIRVFPPDLVDPKSVKAQGVILEYQNAGTEPGTMRRVVGNIEAISLRDQREKSLLGEFKPLTVFKIPRVISENEALSIIVNWPAGFLFKDALTAQKTSKSN